MIPRWCDTSIAKGANVNITRPSDGATPLIAACREEREEISVDIIKALVEGGSKVTAVDRSGDTALAYAESRGNATLADYLRQNKAVDASAHIMAGPPNQNLTPARAWALAAFAIYSQVDGNNLEKLGGDFPNEAPRVFDERSTLASSWDVHSKEDLLYELNELKNTGQRTRFLALGRAIADKPEVDFENYISNPLLSPKQVATYQAARDSYLAWKERTGLAWDLCRYVHVVSMGYEASYITEDQAWTLIQPVAEQLQGSFTSWDEMGRNFLAGRRIFGGEHEDEFEECFRLLDNPKDPNSPWNGHPWNCDLSHLADTKTAMVQ